MLVTFWMIAAGLTIVALAFVIPPLLKKHPISATAEQSQANVAVYKTRLQELETEALTPEQRVYAKQELDKTLLKELQAEIPAKPRARWFSVAVVTIFVPILAISSYLKLGAPQSLDVTAAEAHAKGQNPPDMAKAVEKLAARLQETPADKEGWYMLARSYVYLKRYSDAAAAYNKLLALTDEADPQLLTELAEALALSNGGNLAGQPSLLLKTALAADPQFQKALWLSGFAAAQRQDYAAAINYWKDFLAQVPADDAETQQMVQTYIAEAQQSLSPTQTVESAVPASESTAPDSATHGKVEVHVSLAPALQDQVTPTDTVFIYARATQGPAMPLAVVKKTVDALPLQITLDDTMAMSPKMKLSQFKEINVSARVSRTGTANTQSGDLQGQQAAIVLGQQAQVEVVIDQVVP